MVTLQSTSMEEVSVEKVTVIGIDLAKSVFQLHGATASGQPVFRKKLSRVQLIRFIAEPPLPCRHGGLCLVPLLGPRIQQTGP